jgi:hypothetical protein
MPTLNHYLLVAGLLFAIGLTGVVMRRNIIVVFMCLELMLSAEAQAAAAEQEAASSDDDAYVAPGRLRRSETTYSPFQAPKTSIRVKVEDFWKDDKMLAREAKWAPSLPASSSSSGRPKQPPSSAPSTASTDPAAKAAAGPAADPRHRIEEDAGESRVRGVDRYFPAIQGSAASTMAHRATPHPKANSSKR